MPDKCIKPATIKTVPALAIYSTIYQLLWGFSCPWDITLFRAAPSHVRDFRGCLDHVSKKWKFPDVDAWNVKLVVQHGKRFTQDGTYRGILHRNWCYRLCRDCHRLQLVIVYWVGNVCVNKWELLSFHITLKLQFYWECYAIPCPKSVLLFSSTNLGTFHHRVIIIFYLLDAILCNHLHQHPFKINR